MIASAFPVPALRRGIGFAWRLGRKMPPFWVNATMAVTCMLILPVALGVQTHFGRISDWDYYTGDTKGRAVLFAHREGVLALAERASRLQSAKDEEVRYRWTERAGEMAAGYVETKNGYLPLAPQIYGKYTGRDLSAGVVENDQGTIMIHMTGVAKGECNLVYLWMSDYTKSRASGAFLPKAMPLADTKDAVRDARWEPLEAAVERCKSARYGVPATLLMRFDGFVSADEKRSP